MVTETTCPDLTASRDRLLSPLSSSRVESTDTQNLDPLSPRKHPIQRGLVDSSDCCPKKPKKFGTAEERASVYLSTWEPFSSATNIRNPLKFSPSAHEAEKQYVCSYCGKLFKNKNESQRHENSLHVRRTSWSCSALVTYDAAFYESTNHPGEADTCSYCGEDFRRSGIDSAEGKRCVAIDMDWEARVRHLQDVHKFRQCNASKKFFRTDHFRQYLKHSHAGTRGKWTSMLEAACMHEEAAPLPAPTHLP